MMESSPEGVAVVLFQLVWFVGQGIVFALLWNFAGAPSFGLPALGLLQSIGVFALLRLVIDPPKLQYNVE